MFKLFDLIYIKCADDWLECYLFITMPPVGLFKGGEIWFLSHI
jgi:hypothetical protein